MTGFLAVGLIAVGNFAVGHFVVRTLCHKDNLPWNFLPYGHFSVNCFDITHKSFLDCIFLASNFFYTVIVLFYKIWNRILIVQFPCLSSYRHHTVKSLSHFIPPEVNIMLQFFRGLFFGLAWTFRCTHLFTYQQTLKKVLWTVAHMS